MSRGGYVSGFGLQDYIDVCYVGDLGMYRLGDVWGRFMCKDCLVQFGRSEDGDFAVLSVVMGCG